VKGLKKKIQKRGSTSIIFHHLCLSRSPFHSIPFSYRIHQLTCPHFLSLICLVFWGFIFSFIFACLCDFTYFIFPFSHFPFVFPVRFTVSPGGLTIWLTRPYITIYMCLFIDEIAKSADSRPSRLNDGFPKNPYEFHRIILKTVYHTTPPFLWSPLL